MSDREIREEKVHIRETPPAPRRNWAPLAIILLILAGIGVWAYYATRPKPAVVAQRDIVGLIALNGEIVTPPSARADVYAPFQAAVEKVHKNVGDAVTKGDPLVELAVPNAEAYHEQTKANLQAAETAYANARNQSSASVDAAQKQVDAARAAERAARQAQPPPPTGQEETPVTQPPAGDQQQLTQARIDAETALQQTIADRETALLPYKQQLEAAREANRQARAGEKVGVLYAPITGTLLTLNAQPGQPVGTDNKNPVATVVDLSALQIHAPLDDLQAGYTKSTMAVVLTVPEIPNKQFKGRISRITTRAEGNKTRYVAIIEFKNEDALIKPDMKPQVALKTGEVKNAVAIPREAIDTDNAGRPTVKVLRNGNWQAVAVEPGLSDGEYVQIKSGLKPGETIQVTPSILQAAPLPGKR